MKVERDSDSELIEHSLDQIMGGDGVSAQRVQEIFSEVHTKGLQYSDQAAKQQGVKVNARLLGSFARTSLEFGALGGGVAVANKVVPKNGN
jgi:hypothetical protein